MKNILITLIFVVVVVIEVAASLVVWLIPNRWEYPVEGMSREIRRLGIKVYIIIGIMVAIILKLLN